MDIDDSVLYLTIVRSFFTTKGFLLLFLNDQKLCSVPFVLILSYGPFLISNYLVHFFSQEKMNQKIDRLRILRLSCAQLNLQIGKLTSLRSFKQANLQAVHPRLL
jgi:hypothetical protein